MERPRLSVFRSARHIYCQIVDDTTGRTIAAASSNEKSVNDQPSFESKVAKAVFTGKLLAQRAMDKGVKKVVFDRNGFQMDLNMVFPLDRLNELAREGFIGSVAGFHYSFMGATEPQQMEKTARNLAGIMKKDGVNAVILVPV